MGAAEWGAEQPMEAARWLQELDKLHNLTLGLFPARVRDS